MWTPSGSPHLAFGMENKVLTQRLYKLAYTGLVTAVTLEGGPQQLRVTTRTQGQAPMG